MGSKLFRITRYFYTTFIIYLLLLSTGCGILHPPVRDAAGYYTAHYRSCGPIAVNEALGRYFAKNNIIRPAYVITDKDISRQIQDRASPIGARRLLIAFDRDAAMMTTPSEMKEICKLYGVKLTRVNISTVDTDETDTFIILIHRTYSIDYHWIAHPISEFREYYGLNQTSISVVYLLEPIKE